MRTFKSLFVFLPVCFFITTCGDDDSFEDFKICPTKCADETPWTVESLNLGSPCFETEKDCLEWAKTHGYSGSSCVKCN
ncbi:hypothetical protein [Aestuariivivens sediminicola]|uniref:hypothetical protein n=1 Tax=Aestuariivivens sediminicola TaxID=2913560 RepID=UPI001F58D55D|nr:hypothetical protein [Aestuariivivens sediminicola]